MEKFKETSINHIFEGRRGYIPEFGKQLENPRTTEVEIGNDRLNIDYRIVGIRETENDNSDPVVLIPGFGSGWEGIAELAFSLACEGRKVIIFSFPGYGNSSDPSQDYYAKENFDNEAEVIEKLLDQIIQKREIKDSKFHFVGHSMASLVAANYARNNPEKVSSLVVLSAAGIKENEKKLKLARKFVSGGVVSAVEYKTRLFFSGEKDYEDELYKFVPPAKSPFAKNRLGQRMSEFRRISNANLLETLKEIETPITYMAGELDSVYPPGKEDDPSSQISALIESVNDKTKLSTSVIAGAPHNVTLPQDEITAANIEHYLEKAEKLNSGEASKT